MHPYRPLTLAAALFVGGLSPAFAQSGTEPSSSPSPSSSDSTASSSPSPSSGTELSSAGSGAGEAGAGLKQKQNGIAVQLSLVTRMPFVQSSGIEFPLSPTSMGQRVYKPCGVPTILATGSCSTCLNIAPASRFCSTLPSTFRNRLFVHLMKRSPHFSRVEWMHW